MPLVSLFVRVPSKVSRRTVCWSSQSHLDTEGTPTRVSVEKSWSVISRRRSPSHQVRKFAAGMVSEISVPSAARICPARLSQAPSVVTAQDSAPSCVGSMSAEAPRPTSRVAGIDQRTSPVAASRMVAPMPFEARGLLVHREHLETGP